MTGAVADLSEGRRRISEAVVGGAALSRFQAMMEAQGVAREAAARLCSAHADYFKVLRKAEHQLELQSEGDGNACSRPLTLDLSGGRSADLWLLPQAESWTWMVWF